MILALLLLLAHGENIFDVYLLTLINQILLSEMIYLQKQNNTSLKNVLRCYSKLISFKGFSLSQAKLYQTWNLQFNTII
jgi:hypothetical protein